MAIKPGDVIRLRNEGMAYALKIAKEHGIEELQEQVKMRGYLRATVKFTPEEMVQTIDNIAERIYNNMLTMVYAVLHDRHGLGKKRLLEFKQAFDEKVYLVGERDGMGRHYARFEDYAQEANDLYGLGIDTGKVREAQRNNDENDRMNKIAVEADSVIGWLRKHGYGAAAEAVQKEIYGEREHGQETRNVPANDVWIPVDERLPEEKINPASQDFYEYQVTAKFGNVKDVRHYKYGNGHWWHGFSNVDKYVTAWRERPEPYQPGKP